MNKKLKVLLISNTVFVFAGSMLVPIYALFVIKLGGSATLAGLLYGSHFVANSVTNLLVIRIRDKRELFYKILNFNYLIRGLCWLVLSFNQTLFTLFLIQLIIGTMEAFGTPAFNSLISENLDDRRHIKEWGTWELFSKPAIAVASILGGLIVNLYGFGQLFLIMSIFSFLSLIVLNSGRLIK